MAWVRLENETALCIDFTRAGFFIRRNNATTVPAATDGSLSGRHSIGDSGRRGSDQRNSYSGEYHSSQGENHRFHGTAGYDVYNYRSGGSWGAQQSQGYGEGWNSESRYDPRSSYDRRASGGYGTADSGGQSSRRSGDYGGQWSGQDYRQDTWRRQSGEGPSHSHWTPLPPPSSHSAHQATPPSRHQRSGSHQSFFPPPSNSRERGHYH